jgi:hypothetical protein
MGRRLFIDHQSEAPELDTRSEDVYLLGWLDNLSENKVNPS